MVEEETKEQEETAQEESNEVEVPEKFQDLVTQIEEMSVLDLSELVKVLEDKFGVSAAAPAAVAAAPAAGGGEEGGEEEQTSFTVELAEAGDQKINVIKAIREITQLGLKDAKALVDGAPAPIKENVDKDEADEIKSKVEEAGGSVEVK